VETVHFFVTLLHIVDSSILVLLLLCDEVRDVPFRLVELHQVHALPHALPHVKIEEGLAVVHRLKLRRNPFEDRLYRGGIAEDADTPVQAARSKDHNACTSRCSESIQHSTKSCDLRR